MTSEKRDYRPDIDGLRCFAVLSVVLFHIDPALLPGGFVGVDMFFVISGFLITGIILRESARGCFSFADFYSRRIKRIVPAATVVILSCLVFGQFVLLPEDYVDLSRSALFSQFSLANVYFTFFADSGYFASDASLMPLLHLWSLGVEEQFYMIWPLALLGLLTLGWRLAALIVVVVSAMSFVLGAELYAPYPMFSYYMLPTRMGEMLVGALLAIALGGKNSIVNGAKWHYYVVGLSYALALAGILAIAWSLFWLDDTTPFPGYYALPVTLGTAGLLAAGAIAPNMLSRCLGWKPFVMVGLVSYSMYLWHWPILSFWRYGVGELTAVERVAAFALIALFSVLSYYFVERPFRGSSAPFTHIFRKQFLYPSSGVLMLAGFVFITEGFGVNKYRSDYVASYQQVDAEPSPANRLSYVCQAGLLNSDHLSRPACSMNNDVEPKVLMWGDSNAAHYVGVIKAIAEDSGFSFRNIAHSSCAPLVSNSSQYASADSKVACEESSRLVNMRLDEYDAFILSASWDALYARDNNFLRDFEKTVLTLAKEDRPVVVLGRVPRVRALDRSCQRKQLNFIRSRCENDIWVPRAPTDDINNKVRSVVVASGGTYVDFNDLLCESDRCSPLVNGQLVYYDGGHISAEGSELLGSLAVRNGLFSDIFSAYSMISPISSSSQYSLFASNDSNVLLDISDFIGLDGVVQYGDVFKFVDHDDEAYIHFSPRLDIDLKEGGRFLFRALAVEAKGYPLIRLRVQSGDIRHQYDYLLDWSTGSVNARNEANNVFWDVAQTSEGLELVFVTPSYPGDVTVSVIVYGGASTTGVGYSPHGVGELVLGELELALLEDH